MFIVFMLALMLVVTVIVDTFLLLSFIDSLHIPFYRMNSLRHVHPSFFPFTIKLYFIGHVLHEIPPSLYT